MPDSMVKPDQPASLHCCKKGFLVSQEGTNHVSYKIIGLSLLVGDLEQLSQAHMWRVHAIMRETTGTECNVKHTPLKHGKYFSTSTTTILTLFSANPSEMKNIHNVEKC